MTTFSDLLRLWPSFGALARDIGRPYDTVAAWSRRNSIPARHWEVVIKSARDRRMRGITRKALIRAAGQ